MRDDSEVKKELAACFETIADEAIADRPMVLKARGNGVMRPVRLFKDDKGHETSKVVTTKELIESLLRRERVDVEVQGKRPKWVRCEVCLRRIEVKAGPMPKRCPAKAKNRKCQCGKPIGCHGKTKLCIGCFVRKANDAKTPQQRSEAMKRFKAAMTPEQRSEAARKANAARTPEQRSGAVKKANAVRSPEQRSEAARKANAVRSPEQRSETVRRMRDSMTPEQRSESVRKAQSAMTAEQRSEARRKAWETRRVRAAEGKTPLLHDPDAPTLAEVLTAPKQP